MFSRSLRIKTKAVQGSQAHVARLGSSLGWHKAHTQALRAEMGKQEEGRFSELSQAIEHCGSS